MEVWKIGKGWSAKILFLFLIFFYSFKILILFIINCFLIIIFFFLDAYYIFIL